MSTTCQSETMKKIIIIIAFIGMTLGCHGLRETVKQDYRKGMPYIIPGGVQDALLEEIKKEKEDSSIYFMLNYVDSNYEVSLRHYDAQHSFIKWIENTNRFIYVNKKYYPLLFNSDQIFSTQMSAEEFMKNVLPDGSYRIVRGHLIEENIYRVQFDVRGKIIYQGYR